MTRERRDKGDGSIGQRADGRWYAYLTVGGRRLYHYAHTREEARLWLKRAARDRDEGLLTARRSPTVGVWLTSVRGSLKPKTWATYEQVLRLYILPDLGRVRLRDLAPEDLERVYDALRARGLSPTTAHHAHAVLHRALRQATRRGLVVRNVAELVSAPSMARREMRTLSVDELGRLLTAAEDDPLRALWVVAVTTGMRLGEVLALRWVDVDLERGVITVRASLQRVGGVLRMDTPKTHRSRRPVALTALAREALARHRVEQAAHRARAANLWEERGLVFANSVGRPLEPSNLRRRFFLPLLDRAGLEAVRFHDLRHTVATLLMGSVNPKVVSELLGHSDVATTLRVYSHAAAAMHQEAAASLDALLGAAVDRVSNRVSDSGAEAPKARNRSRKPA